MEKLKEKQVREQIQSFDKINFHIHETKYGNLKLSEGCQYIKTELNGAWIFHTIARAQTEEPVTKIRLQLWYIEELKKKGGLVLFCTDGARRLLWSEVFPCTDFPLRSYQLYVIDRIAMILPMETKESS